MRTWPLCLTALLVPALGVAETPQPFFVGQCVSATEGMRIEVVAAVQDGEPVPVESGTYWTPSPLLGLLQELRWHVLEVGADRSREAGRFPAARNVIYWNEPAEGEEPDPTMPGADSAKVVLGPCQQVGAIYATQPLSAVIEQQGPQRKTFPTSDAPFEQPRKIAAESRRLEGRHRLATRVAHWRVPMPELPWLEGPQPPIQVSTWSLFIDGGREPAAKVGSEEGFGQILHARCVDLTERPQTVCLVDVSYENPETNDLHLTEVLVIDDTPEERTDDEPAGPRVRSATITVVGSGC